MLGSVVIRTRDEAARLRLSLTSLSMQPLTSSSAMEVIVVNDGSVEDTTEDLAEASHTIGLRTLHHGTAHGRSAASNAGAAMASGDVLVLLDGDVVAGRDLVERHGAAHVGDRPVVGRGESFHLRCTRFLLDPSPQRHARVKKYECPSFPVRVLRAPLQWVVRSGAYVRRGAPIAHAPIDALSASNSRSIFDAERRDLHVIFIAPHDGELTITCAGADGWGCFLPTMPSRDEVVGSLRVEEGSGEMQPRVTFGKSLTAGRRVTSMAEQRGDVLSGWYDRARVWWEADPQSRTAPMLSITSLGI